MENNIPKNAKKIGKEHLIKNIDAWWCPDCGEAGDESTIDFIRLGIERGYDDPDEIVQYCCPKCFEQNLYATFIKD